MLNIVKRLLSLAGPYSKKIKISFIFSVLESFFINAPVLLILYVLLKISSQQLDMKDVYFVSIGLVITVILRAIFQRLVNGFESATGYEIFADYRMELGDRLKRLPMGYFSEGNIGNVTAMITSDMVFIEEYGMRTLAIIVSSYFSLIISCLMLMIFDMRIGIITIAIIAIASFFLKKMQQDGQMMSAKKQRVQAELVSAVIEYVKGMSVIKAFNLAGKKAKTTSDSFKAIRDTYIRFEKLMVPNAIRLKGIYSIGIGIIIYVCAISTYNGTMSISLMLMMLIFVYQLFTPLELLAGQTPLIRIMEAGIDRYEEISKARIIDKDGKDIDLQQFDIEFKNVSFAYDEKIVIHDLSFKANEKTMTALVGKSGCGKSTIANLIARFYDVNKGEVKIGGINVKEMTCDSLLKHISMVFQKVYLFNDTILNNIRFGRADATMEEVISAAKKARCYEFIMKMEKAFETIVGEGGATLSGGEKQRISIARAILKDAPIVLLDEATASIDPDNELYIQEAINELIKNKTLIVIAHKLSTIKEADQILVIDEGRLMQQGHHNELIKENRYYRNLWERRLKAKTWKI